jgi:hypothetical protein
MSYNPLVVSVMIEDESKDIIVIPLVEPKKERSASGDSILKRIAVAEMDATKDDRRHTTRVSRVVLLVDAEEVKLKLNPQGDRASRFIPEIAFSRFNDLVFNPAPHGPAAVPYAGGGERDAFKFIAQIKRYKSVNLNPQYGQPEAILEKLSLDDVGPLEQQNFNTFWGFHADHAYAAFHPADVEKVGIPEPDLNLPSELVEIGSWGNRMQASDLLHPTTAVVFVASEASAPLERLADAYRRTVVDVRSYVTQLPIYLSAAATLHTQHITKGDGLGGFLAKGNEVRGLRPLSTPP